LKSSHSSIGWIGESDFFRLVDLRFRIERIETYDK